MLTVCLGSWTTSSQCLEVNSLRTRLVKRRLGGSRGGFFGRGMRRWSRFMISIIR